MEDDLEIYNFTIDKPNTGKPKRQNEDMKRKDKRQKFQKTIPPSDTIILEYRTELMTIYPKGKPVRVNHLYPITKITSKDGTPFRISLCGITLEENIVSFNVSKWYNDMKPQNNIMNPRNTSLFTLSSLGYMVEDWTEKALTYSRKLKAIDPSFKNKIIDSSGFNETPMIHLDLWKEEAKVFEVEYLVVNILNKDMTFGPWLS